MRKLLFLCMLCVFIPTMSGFSQEPEIVPDILNFRHLAEPVDKTDIEVVSASRSTKKIEDLPITIHVITRDEIIQNGYTSLVDVLKSLPGIRVSQPGNGETGENFSMRGLNGNQYTKFLLNNVSIKPTVAIGMPLEAQLPIRQVERIEVIYGPAAAVYGADATAGVINIITKEASQGVFAQADVVLGGNEYEYINFHVGGKAGKNNKILKYSFYGSQMNFGKMNVFNDTALYRPLTYLDGKSKNVNLGGIEYMPSELTDEIAAQYGLPTYMFMPANYEGTFDKPEISDLASTSRLIGTEFRYKGLSLSYQYMYRQTPSSIGRTSYLYKYNDPSAYIADKINLLNISYSKQWTFIKSTTNFSFLDYRQDAYSGFAVTFVDYSDKFYQFTMSEDIGLEQLITYSGKNLEIVSGVSARISGVLPYTNYLLEPFNIKDFDLFDTEQYKSDNNSFLEQRNDSILGNFGFNPQAYAAFATFIQGYFHLKNFVLMAGIRHDLLATTSLDKDPENFSSTNPRIALLYKFGPRTSVRASYGRAFKEPSANMKYNSLAFLNGANLDSVFYAIYPNPELKPEIFNAYELGLRRKLFSGTFLDFTLFYSKIENQIIPFDVPPDSLRLPLENNPKGDFIRLYVNSPQTETGIFGGELSLRVMNIIEKIKLNAEVGITLSKVQRMIAPDSISQKIKMLPEHLGKARITAEPFERTFISVQSMWASKRDKFFQPGEFDTMNENDLKINGFVVFDVLLSYRFSKNLYGFVKINNLTNQNYDGMESTGYDIDLEYNPQYGRNFRFGLSLVMN